MIRHDLGGKARAGVIGDFAIAGLCVYLACHRDEDVKYVLKAFREPKGSFDQRRTEFAALQKINHPSIPRVQEIHRWESPFHLRFDHVPGVPLEAHRSPFAGDSSRVGKLGITLADALAAVHSAGYVHRDVAPDNILIPDDSSDPVRLVDFDMVAPIGTVGPAGTSLYRPPESELGLPWVEASDLYSLGVVLFELLTGRLPYNAASGETDSELVKPSPEERRMFGPLLDPLLRCVASNADARYSSALEFARAVEASLRR